MSDPNSQPLKVGDLIDERYEVREKVKDNNTHLVRYILFDRRTGRSRMMSWSSLRKMFVGRDREYKTAEKV